MMNQFAILKKFVWVIYPVVVGLLILYSVNLWQNGGAGMVKQLTAKRGQVAEEEQKLATLQKKVTSLQNVDLARESESLTWSLAALPAAKQVWVMLGEINNAASQSSESSVRSYQGTVGDVTEASAEAKATPMSLDVVFNVSRFDQVQKIIAVLEKSLPLVKIAKVNFDKAQVKMTIIGAWAGWSKVSTEALMPLPDYQGSLDKLKVRLRDFVALPEEESVVATDSGMVNPF